MDENISVMNKYVELYYAAVRNWPIKHRQLYANFCLLDNIFLYKVSYTPWLLHIIRMQGD